MIVVEDEANVRGQRPRGSGSDSFSLTMRPVRAYKTNMGGRVIILGRIAAVVAPALQPTLS
jgi:hypothetical protein